ncbi:hypothetical protein AGMMS49938_12370 [Fibrobacterales bacterium]|nr:hypothetical protein AGMMS49938_12370 [Fibrobacterales bacterium]
MKNYELTLKLISNLHIGSGMQAQKFEYMKEGKFIKFVNAPSRKIFGLLQSSMP